MRRLSGWDAYLLYAETPTVHTHTLKVAICDPAGRNEPMTFARFREVLESSRSRLGPFGWVLVDVPFGLHHPMWSETSEVDFAEHLFHHTLPAPGARCELDDFVGEIASVQLDRRRPLWTLHYVDGLANGQIALVAKVHHSLADGIASANLLEQILAPRAGGLPPRLADAVAPLPSTGRLLAAAARDHLIGISRLPGLVRRTVAGMRRLRADSHRYSSDDVRMLDAPGTFLNAPLSPRRAFGTATAPLSTVKELGRAAHATVNDVLLALVTGAMRVLFLERGEAIRPIVASVPVSTNRDPDRVHGNHLSGFFLTLPLEETEPAERLRRVRESAARGKHRFELLGTDLYDDWVEYLPPRPSAAVFRLLSAGRISDRNPLFNLPVSTVPGPRFQGYVAEMPVIELYSVGPVMDRSALNVTIWSYHDRLGIGVITDEAVLPEAGHLADLIRGQLEELGAAFDLSTDQTVVGWDVDGTRPVTAS